MYVYMISSRILNKSKIGSVLIVHFCNVGSKLYFFDVTSQESKYLKKKKGSLRFTSNIK